MLVEQLVSSAGKLSILHAPAGFGKTILIQLVQERLQQRGTVVTKALGAPREAIQSPWILLDEPPPNVLASDALRTALDLTAPSNAGIILATRHIDKLPIARLRAEGRAILIGPHQIGISHRDAASALRSALDNRQAERLAEMVGGWTAAIRFLLDHARGSHPHFDNDGDFLASSGLSAYIDQELLGDLSSDWIAALRFASIFSTCDRGMLNAIRPEDDLGRHLASLRRHFPGLVDDRDGQTRLNPLLRLHLVRHFEQLPRPERAEALERASRLCVRSGRAAEAATLVTRVGDPGAIVSFVRRSQGLRLWVTAGFDVIREIVSQAGVRGVEDEPRLKLLKCAVHMKDGEIGEGERLFAEVLPLLAGDGDALRDADVVRTSLLIYGCRNIGDEDVERFRQYIIHNSDDPSWKTLLLSMQCIISIQRGDLNDATACVVEATKQGRAAGTVYGLLFLDIHSINIALARGDLQRARALLSQARKSWRENFSSEIGIQTILDALTASLEFEAGRLPTARVHIRRSTHQMPHVEAWLDIYFSAYDPMARLLVLDIGLPSTIASLRAQQNALEAGGLPRVAYLVKALETCLRGEFALRAQTKAEGIGQPETEACPPSPSWQERELFGMAEAYFHLNEDRPELAIESLNALLKFAEPRGLLRSVMRAKLLLVAAMDRSGSRENADLLFEEALSLGESTGMIRAFAEIGGDAVRRRVFACFATLQACTKMDPKRVKLLRTLARWEEGPSQPNTAQFTPRESDVLAALEHGGGDKLIGRQLGITEHAVRHHLKNIYRKLGVHDRVGALSRARDLGAIS